jgi:hypothetical protein
VTTTITMNSSFYFSFAIHRVFEIATACAMVYWISEAWTRTPAPALVRLARHPARFWIASGLVIVPTLFVTLLVMLLFSGEHPERAARIMVPVFFVLSLFYGGFFGLAAACCAGGEGRLHAGGAMVAATAFVLAPPWYLTGSRWIYLGSNVFCLVLFVAVACLLLADKKPAQTSSSSPTQDNPPLLPAPRSPLPALLLGFTPAILVLLAITLAASGATNHMSNEESRGLLWLASIVSVACCIVSSVMLFKRKTGAAIAGAVLLLLLNGFLSFFFGCCASFVGASFH